MIEGNQYLKTVKTYFDFLITEFDFKLSNEKIRGNAFYDAQYSHLKMAVSISYENMENYLLVMIFILQNGELPDYDDKTQSLHLNQLNDLVLSHVDKKEISTNNEYFLKFNVDSQLERKLLKSAKELRLYLRHFGYLKTKFT